MTRPLSDSVWEQPRLALLYRVSREISSRLNPDDLLPWLLKQTVASLHAQTGTIIMFDEHGRLRHSAYLIEGQVQPDREHNLARMLEHGLAGRVAREREAAFVPNTAEDPRWYRRPEDRRREPQAAICVPLLGRERVVGVLTVSRPPAGAFVADDVSLLTAIADLAGIAVENAQLFAAEQRRREIDTTLREVASTINSTLDLDQVLPLVLEQLARVIEYDSASILLRAGDRLRVSATRGFLDTAAILRLSFDANQGLSSRVVREKRCLVLDDVRKTDEWIFSDVPETRSVRAWIGAPLLAQDEAIGLLSVDSRRPGAYTQADGQVVAAFAEQAASAVVNARLYAHSEQRSRGLRALAATAQAINATREPEEVLRLVVQHAQEWLGMEAATLGLVDGAQLVFQEAVGPVAASVKGLSIALGAGVAGWVAQNNQPIIVPDVSADPRFFRGMDEQTGFLTRALACVPVRIGDRVIGVIEVINPVSGEFDPETLDLLDSLASLAGTAIVQAQRVAELQAAESRFAGLFEDNIDPILISDLDGVITDANRRAVEFFGYDRSQLLGLRVGHLHGVGTDSLDGETFRPLRDGQPITYQTRITTKAGMEIPVEVHAQLIQRGGQQFVQWIQRDLSEHLALEELRGDLLSMVVHDLRSPLGNITSSLEILQDSLSSGDEALLLSVAMRSAGRLSRLVDSLLDLSRLEAGEVGLNWAQTDLNTLLAEAVEQVQSMADGREIQLRLEAEPRLPSVMLDADMIRRVVINLLDNAVKYTPRAGRVALTARPGPDQVTISVHDTGPGIPVEEHRRIFDKFTSVQREGTPKGMGLGLAFCKLAVEAHGGRIWVESARGTGATFSFTLPAGSTAA